MHISEKILKCIWAEQKFKKYPLKISSNKIIKIISPGWWNIMDGPDFKDAVVEINGKKLVGDIEIDVNASDWIAHKHDKNKNYKSVILHVVYINDLSIPGDSLVLKDYIDDKIDISTNLFPERAWIMYGKKLRNTPLSIRISKIINYGIKRLNIKIERFKKRLKKKKLDEVIYQGIMESLGYFEDKKQFIKLSNIVPLDELKSNPSSIKELLLEKANELKWNVSKVRPYNTPLRRISIISDIITKTNYFEEIKKIIENKVIDIKLIKELLTTRGLGIDRINTIIINIMFPLLILSCRNSGDKTNEMKVWDLYKNYKDIENEHISKMMAYQIFGENGEKFIDCACIQQGLIHMFNTKEFIER